VILDGVQDSAAVSLGVGTFVALAPAQQKGVLEMNLCYEPSWSRKLMLLSALVAGGVATQFVPPYQELAFIPKNEASSTSMSRGSASRGMTGIDVNTRYQTVVRSTG
jgi:hypothetical protein